ncbi:hypothetical protein [Hydromonas duriensis]|uniref:Uncharacterized protein n=1 Tax=Hydromonas duriensis TaxID=1527608 RepID=A0A4R6Y1C3_9BURK|nr:hypothetical protein [Hydromonas duriensis]TDR25233.1 hypothetical protein DFR44_1662 [Hydromonas duriensis]
MKALDSFWQKQVCPIFNGILYDDGRMLSVKFDGFEKIEFSNQITVDTFLNEKGANYVTNIHINGLIEVGSEEGFVAFGGGNFEEDAFFAYVKNDSPKWMLFLGNAEEFTSCQLKEENLIELSDKDKKWVWQLDIKDPSKIRVCFNP